MNFIYFFILNVIWWNVIKRADEVIDIVRIAVELSGIQPSNCEG